MSAIRVFVDANVLWSRTLRDWLFLFRNATRGEMFTVCTTEDVIAEAVYTLRRKKPLAPGRLTRAVHDRIVDAIDYRIDDFPGAGAAFGGSDPHDAHVHAAAVADGVSILLTADRGFTTIPPEVVATLPYEVYQPDEFFMLIAASSATAFRDVTTEQLKYWRARQDSVNLVGMLESAGCPRFGEHVRQHLQSL